MVLKRFKSEDYQNMEELRRALKWDFWTEGGPVDEVKGIISDVERRRDEALFELTSRLDGVDLRGKGLRIGKDEIERARADIERPFAEALKAAIKNITSFHRHQAWESQFWESDEGARVGQMARALKRVGAYIPGGSGSYPSTAIMTVVPAKVAGVQEIAVCVPPGRDGRINEPTLFALDLMGVEEIYRVGGAQAIAAMAVGTESIKAVDKIVGPGNVYVTLAKREVFGRVGIDMLAGPSELVIIAEGETQTEYLAYDLLAQLEHGSGARACLISFDPNTIDGVDRKLREILGKSASSRPYNACAVLVKNLEEGVELVNTLAPEHVLISTSADMTGVLSRIHNSGAIFLGVESPVVLGDYAVGVNHVLPTGGAARYASPLSVYDFIKRSNIVFSNPKANRTLGVVVEALARVEGFVNHAESMQKRY